MPGEGPGKHSACRADATAKVSFGKHELFTGGRLSSPRPTVLPRLLPLFARATMKACAAQAHGPRRNRLLAAEADDSDGKFAPLSGANIRVRSHDSIVICPASSSKPAMGIMERSTPAPAAKSALVLREIVRRKSVWPRALDRRFPLPAGGQVGSVVRSVDYRMEWPFCRRNVRNEPKSPPRRKSLCPGPHVCYQQTGWSYAAHL